MVGPAAILQNLPPIKTFFIYLLFKFYCIKSINHFHHYCYYCYYLSFYLFIYILLISLILTYPINYLFKLLIIYILIKCSFTIIYYDYCYNKYSILIFCPLLLKYSPVNMFKKIYKTKYKSFYLYPHLLVLIKLFILILSFFSYN